MGRVLAGGRRAVNVEWGVGAPALCGRPLSGARAGAKMSAALQSSVVMMTARALLLSLLVPAALAGPGLAAPAQAPAPSVEDLVGRLEPCEDLDCPPARALVARGAAIWPALEVGLAPERGEMTRFWTLGVLSEVPIPAARARLEALLAADPLVRIRAAAAFALGNLRTPEVAPALAKALADSDVNVRYEAASALGRSPDKAAVPALLTALRDKDEDVRAAVVEALGAARDPQAVDPLLRRAERDPVPAVRGMAAVALANLRAPSVVAPLVARLASEDNPQALAAVCWALGELGDARALAPLEGLASHPSAVVKQHAAEAVARLKGEVPPPPAKDGAVEPVPTRP